MLDHLSMKHGIEMRSPFVDWDLYEISKTYDINRLHDGTFGKVPIRDQIRKLFPELHKIINRPN